MSSNQEVVFSNEAGIKLAIKAASVFLTPPPKLRPSDWAEQKAKIPTGNAMAGPVRFRNAPYQREPLDMTDRHDVHTITLMWGAQTGKTQVQLLSINYHIDHKPQNQIVMQPTETDLSTWLTTKFDPMIEAVPSLKRKIAPARGRDGINNKKMKQYIGGDLMFSWSGSPSTMRGRSATKIYCDEIDGYERSKEGLQVNLVSERSNTFLDERLLFLTSTPTEKGLSQIETHYDEGDRRQWWVPCPDCGEHQVLVWEQVQWLKDDEGNHLPETASYCCKYCGSSWDDSRRIQASRNGEWRPQRPFNGNVSYHLPSMASLFIRLKDLVKDFILRKKQNDLQTFVNTKLAETWEEKGEKIDESVLMSRVEQSFETLPISVGVLTIGVDIQTDRIECEVVGWSVNQESWSIEYLILPGDPTEDDVFEDLRGVINGRYKNEEGTELSISVGMIDSGFLTKRVYEFCKSMGGFIYPAKGMPGHSRPVVETNLQRKRRFRKKAKSGIRPELIGVDEAKSIIYKRLSLPTPGPGYCHFPEDRDEEYFLQLTSEKIVTRYKEGRPYRQWVQTRPRNEALDCRVYAYAAMLLAGPEAFNNKKNPPTINQKNSGKDDIGKRKKNSGFGSSEWNKW